MKTRNIFEPSDFKGAGQTLIRGDSNSVTLAYKIGYIPEDRPKTCLISLTDGMVRTYADDAALCEYLNSDDIGFSPMDAAKLGAMMEKQGNRFDTRS